MNPILIIVLTAALVAVVVFLVARANRTPPPPTGALAEAARTLGWVYKRGQFEGTLDGVHITLRETTDERPSVTITAQAQAPFAGEVRLSGPSENAGSGVPEVKLTVGRGKFDYYFWIARSKPRNFAAELLGPLEEAQDAMLQAPFGQWTINGTAVSYTTSQPLTDPAQVQSVVAALAKIVQQAEQ